MSMAEEAEKAGQKVMPDQELQEAKISTGRSEQGREDEKDRGQKTRIILFVPSRNTEAEKHGEPWDKDTWSRPAKTQSVCAQGRGAAGV